jgi:nitric oxide reductase subunit B
MWVFGFLITFNLLSFNLDVVRVQGNPTLPYLLAGIGYPGLFLTTLLFVWRFLASMEARVTAAAASAAAGGPPAVGLTEALSPAS